MPDHGTYLRDMVADMTIRTTSQSRGAKAKGRETEQLFCDYLNSCGIRAERRRTTGIEDCGDIAAARLVVEMKHGGLRDVPGGLTELAVEVFNADKRFPRDSPHFGMVVARKKGKPDPANWYCTVPVETMISLIKAAGIA